MAPFRRDSNMATEHRHSKMLISTRAHMRMGSSKVGDDTSGAMALSTKVSSGMECEMVKAYGVRVERKGTYMKGNTRTT